MKKAKKLTASQRWVLSELFTFIPKAAKETVPAFRYGSHEKGEYLMTRKDLEDYARRVYKVALEIADTFK